VDQGHGEDTGNPAILFTEQIVGLMAKYTLYKITPCGHVLEHHIFMPGNIPVPSSRARLYKRKNDRFIT